eukprot:SAG31_NODE_35689_length_320_cov_1.846154_1_plen_79_part_01
MVGLLFYCIGGETAVLVHNMATNLVSTTNFRILSNITAASSSKDDHVTVKIMVSWLYNSSSRAVFDELIVHCGHDIQPF